jgi:hypothetical protein
MQPHQQRVVDEMHELDSKLDKLKDFMHTDTYANLTAVDQGLLMVQVVAMENYVNTLSRRIELF